jgi:sigma-B regulation protein RsbU (phosphoserine phosphatase)
MILVCAITFVAAISWINKPFAGFLIYREPLVGTMSVGEWPGNKAGLRFLERIVAFDGQHVQSGQDLIYAIRQKKLGTVVHYSVQSDDRVRKVSVPVTMFGIKDFFLIFFITFFGGFVLFALGVVVNVLKPDMQSSRIFFFVCLTIGGYMVTSPDSLTNYLFNRINALTLCFMPATVFHLFLIFPHKKLILERRPYLEYLIYIPAFILAILYQIYYFSLSNSISPRLIQWVPEFRTLGAVIRIFTMVCAGCMIVFIIHSMIKASTAMARQRARIIVFGVSIGFLIPALLMVAVYILKINFPWNFLGLFVIFFPASIAYSIIKHNLFDADTIIRRSVGYILVSATIMGAYVLIISSFNIIMGKYEVVQSQAFPIVFTLGVVVFFNPLRSRIQSLVDRIFFRKEYDYGKIIDKIGGAITSLMDLGKILNRLTQTFVSDMFISTTAVMLLSSDGSAYQVYVTDGEYLQEAEKTLIKRDEPIIEIIEKEKKELTRIDVLEDPRLRKISQSCDVFFERLHAEILIPLVYQKKVIGLFFLGEKKSGKSYNRQDLEVFHAVANQGAVAIENARLFQENLEKQRMEEELAIGRELQKSILPSTFPAFPEHKEFDLYAMMVPAREVSGDFYDFFLIDEENLALIMGDVSDKGVPAALFMMVSRTIIRSIAKQRKSPSQVMTEANDILCEGNDTGMFITACLAYYHFPTGRLTYSNGGHNPPLLFDENNACKELTRKHGPALGAMPGLVYKEDDETLEPRQILVLYTDGVTEAVSPNDEIFGVDRFINLVHSCNNLDLAQMIKHIDKRLREFQKGYQFDDTTVLVLKREK